MNALKIKSRSNNILQKQKGASLLLFALILILAGTVAIFAHFNSGAIQNERDKKTAIALAEAKAVLLGRSLMDENRPGSFPCPDSNNNGSASLFTGNACPTYVGRLPWRTLFGRELRDGYGEVLWYAISPNFRDHSSVHPLNTNSLGSLTVDDETNVVAVVFAAQYAINNQARSTNLVTDYLEGENANGDNIFTRSISSDANDKLITISSNEVFKKLPQKIIRVIRGDDNEGLIYHKQNEEFFPFADVNGDGRADNDSFSGTPSYEGIGNNSLYFTDDTKEMLSNNQWFDKVTYTLSSDKKSVELSIGSTSLTVSYE